MSIRSIHRGIYRKIISIIDEQNQSSMSSLLMTNIYIWRKNIATSKTKLDIYCWKSQINDNRNVFTDLSVISINNGW
jgi:hypothetical protein